MFVFIKNSIKRCTALTTGQTFFALTKEFKACMMQYVKMLSVRCESGSKGQSGALAGSAHQAEISLCYLINTGEYCAEVLPQLEQQVQQKMSPTFASKVRR